MGHLNSKALEIHEKKPADFQPAAQAVGCYLEVDGELLVLEYAAWKPESGKWGVPGGKLEIDELPEDAAKRELFEETGIAIQNRSIQHVGSLYIRKTDLDYVYHLFKITLDSKPKAIQLSKEHSRSLWIRANDLKALPLLDGAEAILQKYRTFLAKQ